MGDMRYGERGFMIMTTHPSESNNNSVLGMLVYASILFIISEMYL